VARKTWVFDPDYGGKKVPDAVKLRTEQRLRTYAGEHFAGKYTRLDIRFRGQFCYVDAYTEPDVRPDWPPEDWGVSREQYYEDLRNTPTHLCRLRFFGDEERWGFAFFAYSSEKYELSVFPDGDFFGPPEEAFRVSAGAYLN
jgi:hypothetical protein